MVNLRDEFISKVVEPFTAAYAGGSTPNPCILCNKTVKFPSLLKIAEERNADFIATGHYARVEGERTGEGIPERRLVLKKGIDPRKDQSYVLYVLSREALNRLILPLGCRKKDEIRSIARSLHLPAAQRPESQEICFIEDRYYFRFVEELTEGTIGPVIDYETGQVLGRHGGIHLFTPGQRKRLGIATGRPLYVVKIDAARNAVYVGPKEAALMKEFIVEDINWLVARHALRVTHGALRPSVKVRSTMKDEPATIVLLGENSARIVYDEPQWAPAPGQSAVFYDGDVVLGGGTIS